MIPRTEFLINDLCEEIDFYKEQMLHYKKLYEESEAKYSKLLDDSYKHSTDMCGIMIKSLLSADEKKLAENFS